MKKIKYFIFPILLMFSILSLSTGTTKCMLRLPELGAPITTHKFIKKFDHTYISPNFRYMIFYKDKISHGDRKRTGYLIDKLTGKKIAEFNHFSNATFSPDSKTVLISTLPNPATSLVTIYDVENKKMLGVKKNYNGSFCKNSTVLFLENYDKKQEIHKIKRYGTRTTLTFIKEYNKVLSKEISSDSKYLLVTHESNGNKTDIINVETKQVVRTFDNVKSGHFNSVNSKKLIIQHENNTAEIFEIENDTLELKETIANQNISHYNINNSHFSVIKNWNHLVKKFKLEDKMYDNLNNIHLEFSKDLNFMLEKKREPYESNYIRGTKLVQVTLFGENRHKEFLCKNSRKTIHKVSFIQDSKNNNLVIIESCNYGSDIFHCTSGKTIKIPGYVRGGENRENEKSYDFCIINDNNNKKYICISYTFMGTKRKENLKHNGYRSAIKVFDLDNIAKNDFSENLYKNIGKNYCDLIVKT